MEGREANILNLVVSSIMEGGQIHLNLMVF